MILAANAFSPFFRSISFAILRPARTFLPVNSILISFLIRPTEKYIEIGTAVYAPRFGFRKLSPLLFDQAYGITVKKLVINTTLEKLALFEPGKGAIYVKALSRPKRWNLNVVRETITTECTLRISNGIGLFIFLLYLAFFCVHTRSLEIPDFGRSVRYKGAHEGIPPFSESRNRP